MADKPTAQWLGERLADRRDLTAAARDAIAALPFSVRSFEPGQYLLREGDRPRVCSFLIDGVLYRHKIVGNGGRQIVSIHIARDFVDGQNILLTEADHNIQALTEATILAVDSEALLAVALEHPPIAKALWHESLVEASIVREWVANIGRRDARARTAHMLCELAVRREAAGLGSRESYELPMTQEQLGDALGLTSVHVNRTLKALQAEGAIRRNKRSVGIADWRTLQQIGDFTSNYLHLRESGIDFAHVLLNS
ncbi:Crp/Fnr family transcriptional regulator [Sphingomonas koreensis]|nr:Crp/Fnr family transcriptional regulator [Sphingomonas koreensis]